MPRARGVLMGAHHRGIDTGRPLRALGLIAAGAQPVQDHLPYPIP